MEEVGISSARLIRMVKGLTAVTISGDAKKFTGTSAFHTGGLELGELTSLQITIVSCFEISVE